MPALPHQNLLDKKKSIDDVIARVRSGNLNVTAQGDDPEQSKEVYLARQELFLRQVSTETGQGEAGSRIEREAER